MPLALDTGGGGGGALLFFKVCSADGAEKNVVLTTHVEKVCPRGGGILFGLK